MRTGSFLAELKRRNVWRAAALYIGAIWALAQGVASLGPALGVPEWGTRWFVIAGVIGFPFWLAFAWFYEFTPEGLRRESEIRPEVSVAAHTGSKLDRWIFAVMGLAIVLLVTDRFVLRKGANVEAVAPAKTIAVLPFVNMSDDKANEYFSDGIAEELLNLLATIPQLQVTARTSSFSFKGKDVAVPEIARQLRVAHVLEGSVRKAGDSVRVTAQLVDAASDKRVWSQTWDRKLDDIFAIQDEIAADVVKQLQVKLLGSAPKARTTSPEAYALYLQAVHALRQVSVEGFKQSDALLQRVLDLDPRYAPAWEVLARNQFSLGNQGLVPRSDAFARARVSVERALEIDPELATSYAVLGLIATEKGELTEAARHFERGFALDPGHPGIRLNAGTLLMSLGRVEEALALYEAELRRDPVNLNAYYTAARVQRAVGKLDESIVSLRTSLSLNPARRGIHAGIGFSLLLKGDAAGALAEFEQETNEVGRMLGLPMAYHALGRKDEGDKAVAELEAKHGKDWARSIAYVHAFRAEPDRAFAWLEQALAGADAGLGDIVTQNFFESLHGDPRWLPLLRRIGKAPEQLAAIQFKVPPPR